MAMCFGVAACKTVSSAGADPSGIYGTDGRRDVYEANLTPAERRLADSVAVRVATSGTRELPDGVIDLEPTTLKNLYKVCDGERFAAQPVVGACSGFLIAPDLLATAGHCVKSEETCKQYLWVFGYMLDAKDKDISRARTEDVYRCAKVERLSMRQPGIDYLDVALVRLDRPVVGRDPVPLDGSPSKIGDKVKMMGYPLGLPLKITGDEKTIIRVTETDPAGHSFWLTNLDGYTGNSGSPVFRAEDLSLVGIFVMGDKDFSTDEGCRRSIQRGDDEGMGERVVPAHYLK